MIVFNPQGATQSRLLAAIEKLLPTDEKNTLIVQRLGTDGRSVELAGFVDSTNVLSGVSTALLETGAIDEVRASDVVLLAEPTAAFSGYYVINDAANALNNQDARRLLATSNELIARSPSNTPLWYLRAAGHLMAGKNAATIGDVRVARLLENYSSGSLRFGTLQRFQGGLRLQLEALIRLGASASLTTFIDSSGGFGDSPTTSHGTEQSRLDDCLRCTPPGMRTHMRK
jgi:hypothetical protein